MQEMLSYTFGGYRVLTEAAKYAGKREKVSKSTFTKASQPPEQG
jgi:hypothetical protein